MGLDEVVLKASHGLGEITNNLLYRSSYAFHQRGSLLIVDLYYRSLLAYKRLCVASSVRRP